MKLIKLILFWLLLLLNFSKADINEDFEIWKNKKFYAEDGTVEFSNNNLLILSSTIQSLENIGNEQISFMLSDAEKKLSQDQISDKQKYILNHKIEVLKQIN